MMAQQKQSAPGKKKLPKKISDAGSVKATAAKKPRVEGDEKTDEEPEVMDDA